MRVLTWLIFILACGGGAPDAPQPRSTPSSPTALVAQDAEVEDLAQVLGEAQVLDVRRYEDYQRAHIPGAVGIPLGSLDPREDPVASWDRARPVYIVDARGEHAPQAAGLMAAAGFDTYAVSGGMAAWEAAGLAVEEEVGESTSPAP